MPFIYQPTYASVTPTKYWEDYRKMLSFLRYGSRKSKVTAKRALRGGCTATEALANFKAITANRRWNRANKNK